MKCRILFSWRNKKNILKCRLLKILPRVLIRFCYSLFLGVIYTAELLLLAVLFFVLLFQATVSLSATLGGQSCVTVTFLLDIIVFIPLHEATAVEHLIAPLSLYSYLNVCSIIDASLLRR